MLLTAMAAALSSHVFAAKDFNIKNDTQSFLYVNGASGNIGIGTTTPQGGLVVTQGNVGIGTWSPSAALDTNGFRLSSGPASGYVLVSGSTGVGTWMAPSTINAAPTGWSTGTGTVYNTTGADKVGIGTSTPQGGFVVTNGNVGIGTWAPGGGLIVTTGNVGVGTNAPSFALDVKSPVQGFKVTQDGGSGQAIFSLARINHASQNNEWFYQITNTTGVNGSLMIRPTVTADMGFFSINGAVVPSLVLKSTGNVGIGTDMVSSTARLAVLGGNVGVGTTTPQGGLVVTNGNVGIGTWVTNNLLDVKGSVGIGTTAVGDYTVPRNGLVVMGNVGVGTWASLVPNIFSTSNVNPVLVLQNSTGGGYADLGFYVANGSANAAHAAIKALRTNRTTSGDIDMIIEPSKAFVRTEAIRITGDSLSVGIGTTIPGSKLSVAGGVGIGTGFNSAFTSAAAPVGGLIVQDNVGIGTTTPQDKLIVMGNVGLGTWTATTRLDTDGLRLSTNPAAGYVLVSGSTGIGTWMAASTLATSSSGSSQWFTNSGVGIGTYDKVGIGTSTPQGAFVVTNGNVGIGTWVPAAKLNIKGFATTEPTLMVEAGSQGSSAPYPVQIKGSVDALPFNALYLENTGGSVGTSVKINLASSVGTIAYIAGVRTTPSYGSLIFGTVDTIGEVERMRIDANGNVGIGTTTSQAKLVVFGGNIGINTIAPITALDTNEFRLSTNPAAGYVLVSGSTGIGTWMAAGTLPISGGTSGWSTGSGTVYATTGTDNVGIGTSTPQGGLVVTNGNVGIGTWAPSLKLDVGGFNTTNSNMKTGSLEFNSYALGNAWVSENTYYNGTSWKYRAAGAAGLFYFYGNEGQFRFFASGAAGADLPTANGSAGGAASLKTSYDGSFGVGAMHPTPGNYTGATFVITGSGNVGIGTIAASNKLAVAAGGVGIGTVSYSPFVTTAAPSGGMIIQNNVGIGTTSPQAALTVMGNVGLGTWTAATRLDTDGFRLSRSPASGYVLVSGSTGIGTWMAPGTLPSSGGVSGLSANYMPRAASATSLTNSVVYDTGTNVGIGLTTPAAALEVNGGIIAAGSGDSYFSSGNVGFGTTTPQAGLAIVNGNVGIGTWTATSGMQLKQSLAVYRTTTAATATTAGQTIIAVTDTSAVRTVHLATADAKVGRIVIVKDESGGAGTNNITVDGEGGETIDGASSVTISANYGVLRVYSNGTNWFTF